MNPPSPMTVDFSRSAGRIRALNGVNRGPLTNGGTTDLSAFFRETRIPSVRLHDTPFRMPFTTDMACVFPDFRADPQDPASYRFEQTDDYIAAIRAIGADTVYRFGASIEHFKTKREIHPPADPSKWGEICVQIIRHYNRGWANGHEWNIQHWEIWNEPDIPNCWTGTPEQFADLYVKAAKAIKQAHPDIKVGGPALACPGRTNKFMLRMLEACRDHQAPIDFFSWHRYAKRPIKLRHTAEEVRTILAEYGFQGAESHLNEWNIIPRGDWGAIHGQDGVRRREIFQELNGARGAAFGASALLLMQDAPIDVANFYTGDSPKFGHFDEYGSPVKCWYAFKAFAVLLDCPERVVCLGGDPEAGLALCAGLAPDRQSAAILLSNFECSQELYELQLSGLPWDGATRCEILVLDAEHNLEPVRVELLNGRDGRLRLQAPAATVLALKLSGQKTS